MKRLLILSFLLAYAASAFAYSPGTLAAPNLPMAVMSSTMTVDKMTPSMQQRVGELMWVDKTGSLFNHKENAVWARALGSMSDYHEVDFTFFGVEAGYDKQIKKNMYIGVSAQFGYYSSDVALRNSATTSMDIDGMAAGLGVYFITFNDKGWFIDMALRYIYSMTEAQPNDGSAAADINRGNVALTMEVGKETLFGNGFFIVPSVGLAFIYLGEGDDDTAYGKYIFDDSAMVRGNLNLIAGKDIKTGFGGARPYAKLGLEYLLGNSRAKVASGSMFEEVKTLKLSASLGADLRFADKLFVYAEGGYAYDEDATDINAMFGVRYTFGGYVGESKANTAAAEKPAAAAPVAKPEPAPVQKKEEPAPAPVVREPVNRQIVENNLNVSIEETAQSLDIIIAGFATGDYQVPPSALVSIKEVYQRLKNEKRDVTIYVTGHTDSVGAAESNQRLSVQRANNVMEALVKEGLPRDIFVVDGKGEFQPMVSNDTAEGRKLNRRVEINVR